MIEVGPKFDQSRSEEGKWKDMEGEQGVKSVGNCTGTCCWGTM